jgi:spermidine synthase
MAPVPTYAGGMLALVAAGEDHKALRPAVKILRERVLRVQPRTRYYTPEVHRAAFTLAPELAQLVADEPFREPDLRGAPADARSAA